MQNMLATPGPTPAPLCDTCSSDTGPTTSGAADALGRATRGAHQCQQPTTLTSPQIMMPANNSKPQTANRLARPKQSREQARGGKFWRQSSLLVKLIILALISVTIQTSLLVSGQQPLNTANQPAAGAQADDASQQALGIESGAQPRPAGSAPTSARERQQRLMLFWSLFKAAYPVLALRLLSASADTSWPVDSSDDLVHQMLVKTAKLSRGPKLAPARQRSRPNGWLARVSSNPTYAWLIQHLQQKHALQSQPLGSDAPALPVNSSSHPEAASGGQRRTDNQVSYGRVLYYPPHELGNGRSRTLDKLHQLQQITKSGSLVVDLPEVDSSAASEVARNKYVFGRILYTPERSKGHQLALDQLAAHRQHSRARNQQQSGSAPDSSFGRVIVSPQNPSPDMQEIPARSRWTQARLKQRLQSAEDELDAQNADDGRVETNSELEEQQQRGSKAAESADQNLGQDFEGFWHSGPSAQVEVHRVRDEQKRAPGQDDEQPSTQQPPWRSENLDNAFLVD